VPCLWPECGTLHRKGPVWTWIDSSEPVLLCPALPPLLGECGSGKSLLPPESPLLLPAPHSVHSHNPTASEVPPHLAPRARRRVQHRGQQPALPCPPVGGGPGLGMEGGHRSLGLGTAEGHRSPELALTIPCKAHSARGLDGPMFLRMLRPAGWAQCSKIHLGFSVSAGQ